MILPDHEIVTLGQHGLIKPFHQHQVQPASYDVRLAEEVIVVHDRHSIFRPGQVILLDDQDGFNVRPGLFVLGSTIERVVIPNDLVARLEGKSTLGRKGLIVHATAGYVDPGFRGTLTLELSCFAPIELKKNMMIAQLSFHQMMSAAVNPYSGRYQDQTGPRKAVD